MDDVRRGCGFAHCAAVARADVRVASGNSLGEMYTEERGYLHDRSAANIISLFSLGKFEPWQVCSPHPAALT